MKRNHLFLGITALLVAGGLWLAGSLWRSKSAASNKSTMAIDFKTPHGPPKPGEMLNRTPRLAPPNPTRVFTEFTPEQRVEFARKGHGPGG